MTLFNTFPFQSTDLRNPALGPAASDKTRYADPNHHLNPQPSLADFVPFSSQKPTLDTHHAAHPRIVDLNSSDLPRYTKQPRPPHIEIPVQSAPIPIPSSTSRAGAVPPQPTHSYSSHPALNGFKIPHGPDSHSNYTPANSVFSNDLPRISPINVRIPWHLRAGGSFTPLSAKATPDDFAFPPVPKNSFRETHESAWRAIQKPHGFSAAPSREFLRRGSMETTDGTGRPTLEKLRELDDPHLPPPPPKPSRRPTESKWEKVMKRLEEEERKTREKWMTEFNKAWERKRDRPPHSYADFGEPWTEAEDDDDDDDEDSATPDTMHDSFDEDERPYVDQQHARELAEMEEEQRRFESLAQTKFLDEFQRCWEKKHDRPPYTWALECEAWCHLADNDVIDTPEAALYKTWDERPADRIREVLVEEDDDSSDEGERNEQEWSSMWERAAHQLTEVDRLWPEVLEHYIEAEQNWDAEEAKAMAERRERSDSLKTATSSKGRDVEESRKRMAEKKRIEDERMQNWLRSQEELRLQDEEKVRQMEEDTRKVERLRRQEELLRREEMLRVEEERRRKDEQSRREEERRQKEAQEEEQRRLRQDEEQRRLRREEEKRRLRREEELDQIRKRYQQEQQDRKRQEFQSFLNEFFNYHPPSQRELVQTRFKSYESTWATLGSFQTLTFATIPWPTLNPPNSPSQLTTLAISNFLLSPYHSIGVARRERLKTALRRWHSDKFEPRFLGKVTEGSEREKVREGVGLVGRALSELMAASE